VDADLAGKMSSDQEYIIKPEAKGTAVDYSQFPLLLKVRTGKIFSSSSRRDPIFLLILCGILLPEC
jgi:hypothetical protein